MSTISKNPVTFAGPRAAVLQGLVAEKRGVGYRYETGARGLLELDRFLVAAGHQEATLPQKLVFEWVAKRAYETERNRQRRISLIRALGEYMQRCGYDAFVYPRDLDRHAVPPYLPHIFSRAELARFFSCADACQPHVTSPERHHVFPILFRLLYGCGLRVSEALALRVKDFDLATGAVRIREAKFGKERIVPLHPSLARQLRNYLPTALGLIDPERPLFPSPKGGAYSKHTIYAQFRRFLWAAGISHGGRGRGPRLHDLRHTFAVHCLQRWITKGADLSTALPYLSTYLGHNGLRGTQSYLRLTAELYPHIIASMDRQFGHLLTEVAQ